MENNKVAFLGFDKHDGLRAYYGGLEDAGFKVLELSDVKSCLDKVLNERFLAMVLAPKMPSGEIDIPKEYKGTNGSLHSKYVYDMIRENSINKDTPIQLWHTPPLWAREVSNDDYTINISSPPNYNKFIRYLQKIQ